MPEWRIARAFRTICDIYRIPHTLMTQGSMVLRETWIGHWRGTCAHGGAAKLVVIENGVRFTSAEVNLTPFSHHRPFAKQASQKKSPDSRRGSRCGPIPSGPLHAVAFLIRR
jgi:hypothetical protein